MKELVKKKQLKTKKRDGLIAIAKSNTQVEYEFLWPN